MSLLLLLKPNGAGVPVTPAPPAELPSTSIAPRHKRIPPPQELVFPAGKARILFRALDPSLILLPEVARARISFRPKPSDLELFFESRARKKSQNYRAVRDGREDEAFAQLVEMAYLLTR